ncbi:hypothetical protein [Streptomyces xanthochromogenes]|nr:hypothetical protein [Streptomyces xanthochromogenes]
MTAQPELSGVDLARQAVPAAQETAKRNGEGEVAEAARRHDRAERRA